MTWSGSAEAIAAILALIVPVAIVAVMVTNFPLPQLTNGPLLRALMHTEAAQALSVVEAPALAFELPGDGFTHIAKRFTAPFGAIGPTAFVVAMLTVMAGVASSPWLIPRVTMTPGVYETRKSLGWATVYFGLIMLTAAAVSVYMRDFLMDMVVAGPPGSLPAWMQHLVQLGFVTVDGAAAPLTVSSFGFLRDGVLLSLPVAAGLPSVFVYFAAAGIVAAALRRRRSHRQCTRQRRCRGCGQRHCPGSRCRARGACTWGALAIAGAAVLGGVIALTRPDRSVAPAAMVVWRSAARRSSRCSCCRSGGSA